MKIYIVRDTNYGDIDSIWLDYEEANLRRQECIKQFKPPYFRDFTWIVDQWEVK